MAKETPDAYRLCATCRHLEVVEKGREFPEIADTEYLVVRCKVLEVTRREDYLMEPVEPTLEIPQNKGVCPLWERWEAPKEVIYDLDEETDEGLELELRRLQKAWSEHSPAAESPNE